jgi:hypothetical protein
MIKKNDYDLCDFLLGLMILLGIIGIICAEIHWILGML